MMRAFALLIVLSVLTQSFSKLLVLAGFVANQDYIAKELCVNKSKPRSCCEGKCQLKKNLASDEEHKKSTRCTETEPIWIPAVDAINALMVPVHQVVLSAGHAFRPIQPHTNAVFHPPLI